MGDRVNRNRKTGGSRGSLRVLILLRGAPFPRYGVRGKAHSFTDHRRQVLGRIILQTMISQFLRVIPYSISPQCLQTRQYVTVTNTMHHACCLFCDFGIRPIMNAYDCTVKVIK